MLGSDDDSSYYERHSSFMDFCEPIYRRFGLSRTLEELRRFPDVMPLSNLLHLEKNLRARFLKHELTFVYAGASSSVNQDRVRSILSLAAPLTDLSQIGKIGDACPLVLAKIENIVQLIDQNAFPEAVSCIRRSLCVTAMRLETITRQARIDLLRTAFYLVWKLHELGIQRVDTNPEKPRGGGKRIIFTPEWVVRFLTTVLLFLSSLSNYIHLALDR